MQMIQFKLYTSLSMSHSKYNDGHDLAIQSPVIVDKFNAIAKRHGIVAEQGDQPTEIPLTIIVNEKGIVTQILTTEGTDFELKSAEAVAAAQNTFDPQTEDSHQPVRSNDQKGGETKN